LASVYAIFKMKEQIQMRVKLEKWYLDFTSENEVGFYYIMVLTSGRVRIGFSGINHFDPTQSFQNFRFSRIKRRSLHCIHLSKANLHSTLNEAHLKIDHGKTALSGTWKFRVPPQKRWNKPLYEDSKGWVDWKVWTPLADVELVFHDGEKTTKLKGTGYIDFVRMTLPFWKVPFQNLYWGRMHSPISWSVFLSLQTRERNISLYLDPETTVQDVSVSIERNPLGEALRMIWNIGSPDNQLNFESKIIRVLENQEILSKGRCLKILPGGIRRMLSSSGRDEKYETTSRFRGQSFRGVMEEVKYHE
jgi:hypothetical protein